MSWTITLKDLERATSGQIISKNAMEFTGLSTDSRTENNQKIFFAIKGENFDGHDFIDAAIERGAAAVVVHQNVSASQVTCIRVDDTLKALQALGSFWRHKQLAKIVGITGTNGKTTTKDFATTLISSKYKTICTQGNLNNFIGLPLSLVKLEPQTQVGVFELGLSIPGEMKLLTQICDPDVVVVTSVGRAHLQGLGSLESVAENKGQIYSCARAAATRVFNLDNPYTKKMFKQEPKGSKVYTFSSEDPSATVCLQEVMSTIDFIEIKGTIQGEPGTARVPIFGRHNVSNLMAASALALAVGVDPDHIWRHLPNCRSYWGRNQIVPLKSGAHALFDAYNANPESVEALLSNVSRLKISGKLVGVFGDMLELGDQTENLHKNWGEQAAKLPFDILIYIGKSAEYFVEGIKKTGFKKKLVISDIYQDSLARELKSMLNPGDVILIKGSRGMKLERFLSELEPSDPRVAAKS